MRETAANDDRALRTAWAALGGDPALCDAVAVAPGPALPSVFDVSAVATGAVAAATLAAAELLAARNGEGLREVFVDAHHASLAFGCERHLRALDWTLPPVWDPIAGDYAARDTWIRLHTNYATHRDAALRVLGCQADREAVAAEIAGWDADALEGAVVAAGGCAAALRSVPAWAEHPVGRAVAAAPLMRLSRFKTTGIRRDRVGLAGMRPGPHVQRDPGFEPKSDPVKRRCFKTSSLDPTWVPSWGRF